MTHDRFDLEQAIIQCWSVCDDLKEGIDTNILSSYYDAKFNEIEVVWEGQNEEAILKIDNMEFSVFYESEFIDLAVESYQGYIDDVSLQDIIGSFDNLINFDLRSGLW